MISNVSIATAVLVEHGTNNDFTLWFKPTDTEGDNFRSYLERVGWGEIGPIAEQPCGCWECSYGVVSGHFACSSVSDALLAAERAGTIYRDNDSSGWHWHAA